MMAQIGVKGHGIQYWIAPYGRWTVWNDTKVGITINEGESIDRDGAIALACACVPHVTNIFIFTGERLDMHYALITDVENPFWVGKKPTIDQQTLPVDQWPDEIE